MSTPSPAGAVVVGIDGSSDSDLALDWAARQAALERRPLVLVHAEPPPSPAVAMHLESAGLRYRGLLDRLAADSETLLEATAARATATHDLPEVHRVVRLTDAREALLHAAADAAMLVVGHRGLGPVRQLLLGSVSLAVSKHASCPVVVVRPHEQPTSRRGVVVGIAGDAHDVKVLEFAFDIADSRDLSVTLIHCFWDVVGADDARDVPVDSPGCAEQRAILTAAALKPSAKHPSVEVHQLLSRGFADLRLIEASRDAELLVLGHTRKPWLREVVYGSAAPRVVEHARCTVAIVPAMNA